MTDTTSSQPSLSSEDEPPDSISTSSSDLIFPKIDLPLSFNSLLANSIVLSPPNSPAMESRQPISSSLTESWASLSDISFDDDQQSEHTDLGSLIDVHSAGDVLSVRDDETDLEDEDDTHEEVAENQQESTASMSIETPMNVSKLEESNADDDNLTLEEYVDSASQRTYASKIVRDFPPPPSALWKSSAHSRLVAEIKMPLGKDFIKDSNKQTLRVLLFRPRHVQELDHSILHKLADAQLASGSQSSSQNPPSPSRYHVVPDTFGPGSQPAAAAVVPVEYQLETVHYESAGFSGSNGAPTIYLGDQDNPRQTMSVWDRSTTLPEGQYQIFGSQMDNPDVAVIVIDDCSNEKSCQFARASLAFSRRHEVPAIVLRVRWVYDPPVSSFIENDLHVVVRDVTRPDDLSIQTVPIDVDTFLNLNSAQLSRHIRYLMQRRPNPRSAPEADHSAQPWTDFDIESIVWDKQRLRRPTQSVINTLTSPSRLVPVLIWLLCGFIIYQSMAAFKMQWETLTPSAVETTNDTVKMLGRYGSPAPIESTIPSKAQAIATAASSSVLERPRGAKMKLELEVVGSSHLVVRASPEYRVQDGLQVVVTRQGKPLQAEVRALFPSVWDVRLEADQAYGDVCVEMSMKRPAINETKVVNLGQQPFDAWFKNLLDETEGKIQQKLVLLQEGLETLQREQRPQTLVKNIHSRLSALVVHVNETLRSPEMQDRAVRFQQTVRAQSEAVVADVGTRAEQMRIHLTRIARVSAANSKVMAKEWAQRAGQLQEDVEQLHLGARVQAYWHSVQKGPHSETLGIAQHRAQCIIEDIKERIAKFKA